MKKITHLLTFAFFFIVSLSLYSQEDPIEKGLQEINKEAVKAQLEFLASDWMEGRATGTQGEFLAGDYLASMLQFMGIEPAGDKEWTQPSREQRWNGVQAEEYRSYFQNIYMIKRIESSSNLSILSENGDFGFNENVDYSVNGGNTNVKVNSEIVFVGYGFADKKQGYDDYKGIDVKNKIILRLAGYPGHKDTASSAYKKFHQRERYFNYYLKRKKDELAKEKGAIVIIEIYDQIDPAFWSKEQDFKKINKSESPRSPIYEHNLELPSDTLDINPIKIYPSKKIINKIVVSQGIDLDRFENQVAYTLKPASKKIKDIKLKFDYQVKTVLLHTRNVLGVIEGEKKDEIVVIGGHYDHLGADDGFVWNGADDNASGTVGVWVLANAFKASGIKPKKTIVFAAWTGEEKGLMGSEYFVEHPFGGNIEDIKFYLNFDMISKDSENDTLKNQARMVYTSSYSELEEQTKKNISDYNLNLDLTYRPSEKPRGGSDHASFSEKDIPIMYFMAGFPITYHTPKDQTNDINWDKMVEIIQLSYLNLWKIINEE